MKKPKGLKVWVVKWQGISTHVDISLSDKCPELNLPGKGLAEYDFTFCKPVSSGLFPDLKPDIPKRFLLTAKEIK